MRIAGPVRGASSSAASTRCASSPWNSRGLGEHGDGRRAAARVARELRAAVEVAAGEPAGGRRAQLELGDHVEAVEHERRRRGSCERAALERGLALDGARAARTRARLAAAMRSRNVIARAPCANAAMVVEQLRAGAARERRARARDGAARIGLLRP